MRIVEQGMVSPALFCVIEIPQALGFTGKHWSAWVYKYIRLKLV